MLLLAVVGFRLFPTQAVTVLLNNQAYRVSATFGNQQGAVAAAGVSTTAGDSVLYAARGDQASLAVESAQQVMVDVDGQQLEVRSQATTIGGVLASAGVSLQPEDAVTLNGQLATPRTPLDGTSLVVTGKRGFALAPPGSPLTIAVHRARPVTVYVDTLPVQVETAATTVQAVLQQLGMTVREGDLVRPGLQSPVTAGMVVRLAKARTVNVMLNGKEEALYTLAPTVGAVLKVLGIQLQPGDILSLPADAPVTNGMALTIGTTTTTTEVVTQPLPPPTIQHYDPSLSAGTVQVVAGTPGYTTQQVAITYRNGVEVARVPVAGSFVMVPPVPTRQLIGTAGSSSSTSNATSAAASAPATTGSTTSAAPSGGGLTLRVYATWYTAAQGAWAPGSPNYGRTATGAIVGHGICAVDPSVIPLGTRFYVPGYGDCLAADTGGGIKGYRIDLGFPESVGNNAPWRTGYVTITILD